LESLLFQVAEHLGELWVARVLVVEGGYLRLGGVGDNIKFFVLVSNLSLLSRFNLTRWVRNTSHTKGLELKAKRLLLS